MELDIEKKLVERMRYESRKMIKELEQMPQMLLKSKKKKKRQKLKEKISGRKELLHDTQIK